MLLRCAGLAHYYTDTKQIIKDFTLVACRFARFADWSVAHLPWRSLSERRFRGLCGSRRLDFNGYIDRFYAQKAVQFFQT